MTFKINLDSNKRVPLVPYNPEYPKAVRYSDAKTDGYVNRDNDGPWMSHWADCRDPKGFSGRNK